MRKLIKVIKGDKTADVLKLYLTSKKCCLLKAHTESIRNIDKSCILLLSTLKHLLQTRNLRKSKNEINYKILTFNLYSFYTRSLPCRHLCSSITLNQASLLRNCAEK